MARKYARFKEDGYVMNFSIHLDAKKFDFFEADEPPPEFIDDLPAYLAGQVDAETTNKRAKAKASKKDEPVFLRDEAGNLAS